MHELPIQTSLKKELSQKQAEIDKATVLTAEVIVKMQEYGELVDCYNQILRTEGKYPALVNPYQETIIRFLASEVESMRVSSSPLDQVRAYPAVGAKRKLRDDAEKQADAKKLKQAPLPRPFF